MANLFDKLSTLVSAQVNDLLGKNPQSPLARIKLNAEEAEKNPRSSARSLRQRLDEAIDYESELQQKIDRIAREALELDQLVDETLGTGDEFTARRLQGQLNAKQQQLTIAESELRDHRLVTQHLMQELTSLEMALDNQERQARQGPESEGAGSRRTRIPVEGGSRAGVAGKAILGSMTDKLNETREGLESLLNNSPVPDPPEITRRFDKFEIVDEEPDPRTPKRPKADAPDMNTRLSRLSKPDDD